MPGMSGVGKATSQTITKTVPNLNKRPPLDQLLRDAPKRLKDGIREQKKEDPLLLWAGMGWLPAAIITPFTMYWDLKRKAQISAKERHLLVTQETIRQIVSASVYWISYYGTIILVGLKLKEPASGKKSVKQFLLATLTSAITGGIMRPIITNAILARHQKRDATTRNPFQTNVSKSFLSHAAV